MPQGNVDNTGARKVHINSLSIGGLSGANSTGVYFGSTTNANTANASKVSAGGTATNPSTTFCIAIDGGTNEVQWVDGNGSGWVYDNQSGSWGTPFYGSFSWSTVPGAPASISYSIEQDTKTVSVTIGASSDNGNNAIINYWVYCSIAGGAYTTVLSGVQAGTHTFAFPGAAGQAFVLRVLSANGVGDSSYRTGGSVTAPTIPAVPGAPITTVNGSNGTVNWSAPANGGSAITGYTLQQSVNGGAYSTVYTGTATSYAISGVAAGDTVTYQVLATNIWGSSAYSAASASAQLASVPAVPAAPTGSALGIDSIQVTWAAPYNGGVPITSYTLQVFQGGVSQQVITGISPSSTQYDVAGLLSSTAYTFEVLAVNSIGSSAYSAASTAISTLAGNYVPPASITANTATSFTVSVSPPPQYPGTETLGSGVEFQIATNSSFTTPTTVTDPAKAPMTHTFSVGDASGVAWTAGQQYFIRAAVKYSDGTYGVWSTTLALLFGGGADGQVGDGTNWHVVQMYYGDGVNWHPINAFVGDGTNWKPLT